jgi:uncharacterized protein (TIGR02246 family)
LGSWEKRWRGKIRNDSSAGEKKEKEMIQQEVGAIVRKFEDEYAVAFGRKDAKALSDLLAEDATLLSEWGDVMQGRAKIERMLAKVFPSMPDDLKLVNTPEHSRAITDNVIVSHGVSHQVEEWGIGEENSRILNSLCDRAESGALRPRRSRRLARCRTRGRAAQRKRAVR